MAENNPTPGKSAHLDSAPRRASPAAWGEPIARFEHGWTRLETGLITFVLVWQLLALVIWVFLNGLSSPPGADGSAGTAFRAAAGAVLLGVIAWSAGRRLALGIRRGATIAAIAIGFALVVAWRGVGVEYFDNVKGWLQEGSTLTLLGGLRGLATRLTLWLALIGASLATSAGKHIHVDVVFRFLPKRLRLPAACVNYASAALVCFAASWAFVDYISIQSDAAKEQDAPLDKTTKLAGLVSDHISLTVKQIGLDLRTLTHVGRGQKYDRWMSAHDWNEWVRSSGFERRYKPEQIENLVVPEDAPPHAPLVIAPTGESVRGMLGHDLNLVFPFGLIVIGLRMLLRLLLSISGHIPVDPDEAHRERLIHEAAPLPTDEAGGA